MSYANLQITHTCQVCAKTFQSQDNLKSHLAIHHPVEKTKSYAQNSYQAKVSELPNLQYDLDDNQAENKENYYIPMNWSVYFAFTFQIVVVSFKFDFTIVFSLITLLLL